MKDRKSFKVMRNFNFSTNGGPIFMNDMLLRPAKYAWMDDLKNLIVCGRSRR